MKILLIKICVMSQKIRRNFIPLCECLSKEKKSNINNLSFHSRKLGEKGMK